MIDTSNINLGLINPFRFKSYYQDDETGWYYLNSIFYNPLSRRFITMDNVNYLGTNDNNISYNFKGGGSNIYYFESMFKILERYLVR